MWNAAAAAAVTFRETGSRPTTARSNSPSRVDQCGTSVVASERALAATRYHRLISSDVAAINLAEGKIKVRDETGQTGCICATYRVSKTLHYSLSLQLLQLCSPAEERGVGRCRLSDRTTASHCVANRRENAVETSW